MADNEEKNLRFLIEHAAWLANDCGGCETCAQTFKPWMHEMLIRDVEALPNEYRMRFHEATGHQYAKPEAA